MHFRELYMKFFFIIMLSILLVACGGSDSKDNSPINNETNVNPTANAGEDQVVNMESSVILSGSGTDEDGSVVSYHWVQNSGITVDLLDADVPVLSFISPSANEDVTLSFELTVTDQEGATGKDSVDILVVFLNSPPIADAGVSQFVVSDELVTLDARDSSDFESAFLSYSWRQIDDTGISIELNDSHLAQPAFTVTGLTAAITAIFEVQIFDGIDGASDTVNIAIRPVTKWRLNDTGITLCGDYAYGYSNVHSSDEDCSLDKDSDDDPIPDEQDADFGRDKIFNNKSDGIAGFSYTKLDDKGDPLPQTADNWSCVLDNVTGLVWEGKTGNGDLHDISYTYTWYDPDDNSHGGSAGTPRGGNCNGSDCDTQGLVNQSNSDKYCGMSNWRVPSKSELHSLMFYGVSQSALVDTNYFPNTYKRSYWTSTAYSGDPIRAWFINFRPEMSDLSLPQGNGVYRGRKDEAKLVRLASPIMNFDDLNKK